MGSQSEVTYAYIAGFLDGDGSLMLQLKKRKDSTRGFRFMCTICFYQKSLHREPLFWMKEALGIGYLSDRNDGISELRINGYKQVYTVLSHLVPYIKFKKEQAEAMLNACDILNGKNIRSLSEEDLRTLVSIIILIQSCNYATKSKKKESELLLFLGLTP